MSTNTAEVLNRGMECLVNHLGLIEAESFISIVIRGKFDYTIGVQRFHFYMIHR